LLAYYSIDFQRWCEMDPLARRWHKQNYAAIMKEAKKEVNDGV